MSIEVRSIQKRFGGFTALDNVSLKFPDGKLTALLGPSGCGKTTLLRIIAGLEHPDSGEILLNGESATERHLRERQVGLVFQHYSLFKHLSVVANIAIGLREKPRTTHLSKYDIHDQNTRLKDLVHLAWLFDTNDYPHLEE